MSLRYSILELEWLNFFLFSVLVDSKSLGKWFDDEYKFYYDPVLRLHMPCSKKWTIFSAIAPSFHFATGGYGESFYYESIDKVSFKTDLGVRYYDDFFSNISVDLFLRYKHQNYIAFGVAMRVFTNGELIKKKK